MTRAISGAHQLCLRAARLGSHVESLRDFLCLRSEGIFRWGVSEANEGDRFDTMTVAARFAFRRPRLGRLQNGVCRAGVSVWGLVWGGRCGARVSETGLPQR